MSCKYKTKEIEISGDTIYSFKKKGKIIYSELPIASKRVTFTSMSPGETKIVVVNKCKGIIIYKFFLPCIPSPPPRIIDEYYIIPGGYEPVKNIIHGPTENVTVIIFAVGPGGNGGNGGNASVGNFGGGGGGGGSGGYASEVFMTSFESNFEIIIGYSIGIPSDDDKARETTIVYNKGPSIEDGYVTIKIAGGKSGINGGNAIDNKAGYQSPGLLGGQGNGGYGGYKEISQTGENGHGTNPGDAGVVSGRTSNLFSGGGGGSGGIGEKIDSYFFKIFNLPIPSVPPAFRGGDGASANPYKALNGFPGTLHDTISPIPGYGCGGNGGGGGGGAGAYDRGVSTPGPGGRGAIGGFGLLYVRIFSPNQ